MLYWWSKQSDTPNYNNYYNNLKSYSAYKEFPPPNKGWETPIQLPIASKPQKLNIKIKEITNKDELKEDETYD